MKDNILTYLRIKETSPRPIFSNNQINIENKTYQTDTIVYGPDQKDMFHLIAESILTKCMQGYNCSVFAYGQTGSGKTYTIQGTDSNPGLVQCSLSCLHNNYDELKLSFIEIYNENMIDLFDPEKQISIREDPVKGVVVDALTVFSSESLTESLEFYRKGISNRKTAATQMNLNSSRSHSIFTIELETKNKSIIKRSKLCFVDLAGSEKIVDKENDRIKETCNINKSLLCLGKIVHKLSSNDKWHISYRDSKLTFLLKDSLGGNSVLAIIGTINLDYPSDSINTLNFLNRSKLIKNCPSINYDATKSTMAELVESMKDLDEENSNLKAELASLKTDGNRSRRASMLYHLKSLKTDVALLSAQIDSVSENNAKLIENYYEGNKKIILEINEKFKVLDNAFRENINNFQVKRRKTEE